MAPTSAAAAGSPSARRGSLDPDANGNPAQDGEDRQSDGGGIPTHTHREGTLEQDAGQYRPDHLVPHGLRPEEPNGAGEEPGVTRVASGHEPAEDQEGDRGQPGGAQPPAKPAAGSTLNRTHLTTSTGEQR